MLPLQPNNEHIQANDSFQGGLVNQFEWPLTSVYSPNSNVDHRLVWEELAGLISWWGILWCVRAIISEGSGAASFSLAMDEFLDLSLSRV